MRTNQTTQSRIYRRARVRRKVKGTVERPRLSVFRSNKHIYAQVITDVGGTTLVSVSTMSTDLRGQLKKTGDLTAAKEIGLAVARRCKEKGITAVVFDRNGFLYHGRVKAVADGAREGGLQF